MGNSCFGAMVLIMLVVAVAVFLLTPHERRSTFSADAPAAFWSGKR